MITKRSQGKKTAIVATAALVATTMFSSTFFVNTANAEEQTKVYTWTNGTSQPTIPQTIQGSNGNTLTLKSQGTPVLTGAGQASSQTFNQTSNLQLDASQADNIPGAVPSTYHINESGYNGDIPRTGINYTPVYRTETQHLETKVTGTPKATESEAKAALPQTKSEGGYTYTLSSVSIEESKVREVTYYTAVGTYVYDLSIQVLDHIDVVATYSGTLTKTASTGEWSLSVVYASDDAPTVQQDQVDVPNVTGLSFDEAKTLLEAAGFVVQQGDDVDSTEFEVGKVAAQSVTAGSKAAKGSTITLQVAKAAAIATNENTINENTANKNNTNKNNTNQNNNNNENENENTGNVIEKKDSGLPIIPIAAGVGVVAIAAIIAAIALAKRKKKVPEGAIIAAPVVPATLPDEIECQLIEVQAIETVNEFGETEIIYEQTPKANLNISASTYEDIPTVIYLPDMVDDEGNRATFTADDDAQYWVSIDENTAAAVASRQVIVTTADDQQVYNGYLYGNSGEMTNQFELDTATLVGSLNDTLADEQKNVITEELTSYEQLTASYDAQYADYLAAQAMSTGEGNTTSTEEYHDEFADMLQFGYENDENVNTGIEEAEEPENFDILYPDFDDDESETYGFMQDETEPDVDGFQEYYEEIGQSATTQNSVPMENDVFADAFADFDKATNSTATTNDDTFTNENMFNDPFADADKPAKNADDGFQALLDSF